METAEHTGCFLLCNTEGADVHVHVVDDHSFRTACDAVEAARTEIAKTSDERWDRMCRFNEIVESGALLTFSSDVVTSYELHRSNPLSGMQVAATRVDPEYPLSPARNRVALGESRTPGFPVSCCWPDTRSTAPSDCGWPTRSGHWRLERSPICAF
jgi:predicted amidohydrolase YtcJ